jgi:hypothetical protein
MVADGVGTAGRGGEGADLAVEAAARYLSAGGDWDEGTCRAAVRYASDGVLSGAGAMATGAAPEFSTTFVVALVTAPPGRAGGADVVLGRVGDSTAFGLAGGAWKELFLPSGPDELHEVATAVLPWPGPGAGGEAPVETATAHLPVGAAIVLLTDGIADPLRDGPTTVAPALAEVLRAGPRGELSPLALAAAADFSRRGCQDDRTIVVAWPYPTG